MDNLEKITIFLKCDLEIKKIMANMAPTETDKYNITDYSDRLNSSLKDIKFYFEKMMKIYNTNQEEKKFLNDIFNKYFIELANCSTSIAKYNLFYQNCVSNLREELIDEVGEKCHAYGLWTNTVPISHGNSINEILHIIHQRITNDENLYKSIPPLNQKMIDNNEIITLYGNNTEIGNKIFNSIPNDIDVGITDILAISEDKVLLLIRDRGHALSIEIEKEENKYYINYYIPKICNIDMVNNIKGVRKVNENSKYTTGIIETNEQNLDLELISFINSVPTDFDMIYNISR